MMANRAQFRVRDILRSESASIPMVMLAAIVLGGLIVALYSQVNSGQITARGDRDYQGAIQVADAGVQAGYTELSTVDPDDAALPSVGEFYPDDPNAPGVVTDPDAPGVLYATASVGEGEYHWRARRIHRTLWEVRSAGTYRDRTRYVEALIGEQPIFPFALFGDDPLDLSKGGGNNTVNSLTATLPRLGSNGRMALRTQLLDQAPEQLILECFGENAAGDCPEQAVVHRTEVPFDDLATLAYGAGGECTDPSTGAAIDHGILDWAWFEANGLLQGSVYCFSQVLFEAGSGTPRQYPITPVQPDPAKPTRIYINPAGDTRPSQGGGAGGGDSVGLHVAGSGTNSAEVNWSENPPRASDLLIFVPGTRTVKFDNNQSRIAAGVYAPFSTCDLRAQGTIVGSLICGSIEGSGGGWTITYDDRLLNFSHDDVYTVLSWSEQAENLSGFTW